MRNPISAGEPRFDRPLQASKGLVFLAKDREDTACVIENGVVVGRQRHRPLIPLFGTLDVSKPCQNYGTQVKSARLVDVQLQVPIYRLDCEMLGAVSLVTPPKLPQDRSD